MPFLSDSSKQGKNKNTKVRGVSPLEGKGKTGRILWVSRSKISENLHESEDPGFSLRFKKGRAAGFPGVTISPTLGRARRGSGVTRHWV